jgi:hypothetical protein
VQFVLVDLKWICGGMHMIINLIYVEIVYKNIVTFCTEKCTLMLMERVGFEPEIL